MTSPSKRNEKERTSHERLIELISKVGVLVNSIAYREWRSLPELVAFLKEVKKEPLLIDSFIQMAEQAVQERSQQEGSSKPRQKEVVRFRPHDKELIVEHLRDFKNALEIMVQRKGGSTWLAKQLGVSTPNISRFFRSDSIPRQATLQQIFEALGVEYIEFKVDRDEDEWK
jgi:DNA-binding phage protein